MFLASYLSPAILCWIARFRRAGDGDHRIIQKFFVLFGIYLAFTAICESHGASALIFPKYIMKTRLHYEGRSVGPFLSAPAMGTWLTVASICLVLMWTRARPVTRAALFALFVLFAYAQYLTQTRSAWMGYVVAVPLVTMLSARRTMRHVLIVGLILLGLVGGIFAGERFLFPERKEGAKIVAHSTYQRLALLQRSLAMFVQRPIFGCSNTHLSFTAVVAHSKSFRPTPAKSWRRTTSP
jgi:O-antigen ligase